MVVAVIVLRLIYLKTKEIREQDQNLYRRKIVAKKRYLYKIYDRCNKNYFTRWYIEKVSKGFQILYPGEQSIIITKTMKTAIFLWGLCCFSILTLFYIFPYFHTVWTVSFLIIVIHIEVVSGTVKSQEIKLLSQFEKYLSDVRHNYYINHMVEESLEDAILQNSKEMTLHAAKLHNIVTSDNPYIGFRSYNDTGPNKYLRLFLALSIKVIDYGDQIIDGQSLYLRNINNLKNDIHIELLKIKNTKFAFSGLNFLIVTPIFFLYPIRNWGISNLPELINFYDYSKGKILAILIYILTFISYFMLNQLKEVTSIIKKDYILLNKILRISIINISIENYINKYYSKILSIQDVLKQSGEQVKIKVFILKRFLYGFAAFFLSLTYFVYLNYQEQWGLIIWYQIIVSFLFAIIVYYYPYWMILYRRKIMKMNMEDEVIQFQSIIMMIKNMERISIRNILEFMEDFAVIFKESIHICINDFDGGDLQALEELKEKEVFEPFRRIVNGLIISDKIGIEKAFDEISTDQVYYQDKRKQDNEMILSKKAAIGKIIANVPVFLTVGFYLIVPFIVESLNQLREFSYEWNLYQ